MTSRSIPKVPFPPWADSWPDGFNALIGDGSVRFFKKQIDPNTLKALITRAGGEVISDRPDRPRLPRDSE